MNLMRSSGESMPTNSSRARPARAAENGGISNAAECGRWASGGGRGGRLEGFLRMHISWLVWRTGKAVGFLCICYLTGH
jgi:hypothetical protein